MCVVKGRVVVMVVYVGGSYCRCVNDVCMEVTECGVGCVGVGWVCVCGCGSRLWVGG